MFSRSSWLHLRIPFSYFLLPIFLFSLSISPNFSGPRIFWVFFIVHFFLYPASNGYNSYFDKDEKSIGGLKNPPPVNKGLYYLSLLFDAIAIILALIYLNVTFALMLLVYGVVSKAYSHPAIRLKKYAIASWLTAGFFQGLFTFAMCYIGINNYSLENILKPQVLIAGLLTTIMLMANYPMTQIYQHEEDQKRGDLTLSLRLGIPGTFYFTAAVFGIAITGFLFYFNIYYQTDFAWLFSMALLPVLIYFFYWFILVMKNTRMADYTHAMWLNFISATALNAFFIYFFLTTTQVLQVFS
jgi:1,4-dihydroxy-2-naphthoate octaprenyltransferase